MAGSLIVRPASYLGARFASALARAGEIAADARQAFQTGLEQGQTRIGELRKAHALEQRADTLGLTPGWYQQLAEEYGEEALVQAVLEKAAPAAEGSGKSLINWRGLTEDPYEPLASYGGWRERPSVMSYGMLELIAKRCPPLTAYIQTRLGQLTYYADPQRDQHGPGFVIRLRDEAIAPKAQRRGWGDQRAREIAQIITQCGRTDRYDGQTGERRDSFLHFLRKIVRDTLIHDQINVEKQRTRGGDLVAWRALDAKSIRMASKDCELRNLFGEPIRYAQIIDGTVAAEFSPGDLSFNIRNPRADLRTFGYGFCLHPDSRVSTNRGLVRIEDLAGTSFRVWIDGSWQDATAFATRTCEEVVTTLRDGRQIKSSPDHRLLVVDDNGCWVWRRVTELRAGDAVAFDMTVAPETDVPDLSFSFTPARGQNNAKPWSIGVVGPDMWEFLGWVVGDGCFTARANSRARAKIVRACYALGEEAILERHLAVLEKYGIPPRWYDLRERHRGLYGEIHFSHEGFGTWLQTVIGMPVSKLRERAGKLPPAVFLETPENRAAFLRGLYSADGHVSKAGTVHLGCTDAGLLADVQRLLVSLGIRSRWTARKRDRDLGYGVRTYDEGTMYVYDTEMFWEKVRFVHDRKNERAQSTYQGTRADTVAPAFGRRAGRFMQEHGIETSRANRLCAVPPTVGATRSWLASRVVGDDALQRDLRWGQAEVESVRFTGNACLMYDVSVESEEHAFTVDGVVVHNSETEMMIAVVTSILNGFEYNSNFFKQGTTTKGVLAINGIVPRDQFRQFKRMWMAMVTGAKNAWRTPLLNLPDEHSSVKWVDLQKSNLDMEFSKWLDWLLRVCCGVLQIAPEEIGFQMGPMGQTQSLGDGGGKGTQAKIDASKDRGLRPLLRFLEEVLNEEIIWLLDPRYELAFVGLDASSEEQEVELLVKEVGSYKTLDEAREARNLPPMKDGSGEVVLNAQYIQHANNLAMQKQQAAMQGGPGGPGGPGGFDGAAGFSGEPEPQPGADGQGQPQEGAGGPENAAAGQALGKSLTRHARVRRLKADDVVSYEIEL